MRKKEEKLLIKLSLLIGDAILIATSFLLSYWLRFNIRIVPVKFGVPPLLEYLKLIPVAVLLWIFIFTKLKVYELKLERISVEFYQIIKGVSLGMGILIIISFFYRSFEYSRIVAILLWIISTLLLICFRILMYFIKKSLYKKGYGISNVLIVGAGKIGNMIYEKISQNSSYGYKIVGFLDDNVTGEKILGKTNELSSVIQKYKIDEVIFALPFRAREKIFNLVLETESNYAKAYVIPDFFELISKKIDIEKFEGVPLLKFKEIPLSGYNIIIKRMFDLTFSILFVITFSIVYLIIAILIKITSKGSIFYIQERVGRDGKIFRMYKFRTMYENAEKETGPVWAKKDDPRRTPIGKILRRFSLDELPQFFNVIKGDMSIVGPRPERPIFVSKFQKEIDDYFIRHKVKSGITGWAQVNGLRGNTSIEERTKYDLYYVKNWSLIFDIRIILTTFYHIIVGKNAY